MQGQQRQHLWAWNVSALVYEWAYIRVAHQTDVDLFAYLGDRVVGATVADCGCGLALSVKNLFGLAPRPWWRLIPMRV